MTSLMWQWLHDLSPGQATFLGWVVGFFTVVGGALLNAHLNRRRDDRLRQEDRRALVTALKAELAGLQRILLSNSEYLQKRTPESDDLILIQDLAQSVRIMPEMIDKFGLLDPETIQSVVAAHMAVEEYCEKWLTRGGRLVDLTSGTRKPQLAVPADKRKLVIAANTGVLKVIEESIAKLDAEIARMGCRGGAGCGRRGEGDAQTIKHSSVGILGWRAWLGVGMEQAEARSQCRSRLD
jgi:hypothetical protein